MAHLPSKGLSGSDTFFPSPVRLRGFNQRRFVSSVAVVPRGAATGSIRRPSPSGGSGPQSQTVRSMFGVRLKFTGSEAKRIDILENEGGIVALDRVP